MNSNQMNSSKSAAEPSCSFTLNPEVNELKRIMKSTPKVNKIVSNIWKRQHSIAEQTPTKDITVVTIEDTSTEDSPGDPTQMIQVVNLESTEEQEKTDTNVNNEQVQEPDTTSKQVDTQNTDEEHDPAITSSAKSSISDLQASDFF